MKIKSLSVYIIYLASHGEGVKSSEKVCRSGSWAHVPEQGDLTGLNSGLSDAFGITTSFK